MNRETNHGSCHDVSWYWKGGKLFFIKAGYPEYACPLPPGSTLSIYHDMDIGICFVLLDRLGRLIVICVFSFNSIDGGCSDAQIRAVKEFDRYQAFNKNRGAWPWRKTYLVVRDIPDDPRLASMPPDSDEMQEYLAAVDQELRIAVAEIHQMVGERGPQLRILKALLYEERKENRRKAQAEQRDLLR